MKDMMFEPLVATRTNMDQLDDQLSSKLGKGAVRFGPIAHEPDIKALIEDADLTQEQVYFFATIKASWDVDNDKSPKDKLLTNEQVFRIVAFCDFNEKRIMRLLSHTRRRYFEISSFDIEKQLLSKTLFPCPGLTTKEGWDTFYMRPSRYFVKETPTRDVIDNLLYVMDHMKRRNPYGEMAFLANMEGWTMENFSNDYCMKFMAGLQGRIFPAKVSLFMILNPPSWFGNIWKFMKTVLSAEFVKKVVLITDEELPYLMDLDYEKHLPDEIPGGQVDTDELVKDFVDFCKGQDLITRPRLSNTSSSRRRRGFFKFGKLSQHSQRSYDERSEMSECGTVSSSSM
eukprot:Nitzschia sp. Nitz4//scaffold59_size112058//25583//26608//NITZ4_004102-RA/size112058-processed-gene-0.185-mRNA-1//1//CDS//3329555102//1024//frame0